VIACRGGAPSNSSEEQQMNKTLISIAIAGALATTSAFAMTRD
jgi:hypothetical protein